MAKNSHASKLIRFIKLPLVKDDASLVYAEEKSMIPFAIKRVYFISDILMNSKRGFHAHKNTQQVIFCIQGKFTLTLDNGKKREKLIVNKLNKGIFIDKMMWHEMDNFSSDAILLVFASEHYDENDYIRDHSVFINSANKLS